MKKLISLVLALMVCFSVCGVAHAAKDDFVPSISYKDGPGLVIEEDENGRSVAGNILDSEGNAVDSVFVDECLVITTIAEALNDIDTGIPSEAEELLESVYREILDGTMELPFENADEMAIIHLVDASFLCNGSTESVDHEAMLESEGILLELTFDLGVGADVPVTVMCYVDGKWVEVQTVNNGDGTVTCLFEKLCPIAFAVPATSVEPPKTGDDSAAELGLWFSLMAVSFMAVVGLMIFRRKIVR